METMSVKVESVRHETGRDLVPWAVVAITVLALALRLYRLDFQALWYDEVLTFLQARLPLSHLLGLEGWHARWHSLYYLVMHVILDLGGRSEIAMRLPSVLLGTATVPILYRIASSWFGRRIGLASAVLLALSPLHLYYSQEARPYATLLFLALAALVCLQRVVEDPSRSASWVGFVVAGTMALYCHPVALAFLVWCGLYGWIELPTAARSRGLAAIAVIALLWGVGPLTVGGVGVPRVDTVTRNRADPYAMAYVLWTFAAGFSLGPSVRELHAPDRVRLALASAPLVVPVLLAYGSLLALGARRAWQDNRRLCMALAGWIALILAAGVMGDLGTRLVFNVRYVLLALPPFLILVAMGAMSLGSRPARWIVWGFLTMVSVISIAQYMGNPRYHRDDYRSAAAILRANAEPGDLLIVSPPFAHRMFAYYDPGNAVPTPYPRPGGILESAGTATQLEALIGGRKGFWLVLRTSTRTGPLRKALADRHRLEGEWEWPGVRLLRYSAPAASPEMAPATL